MCVCVVGGGLTLQDIEVWEEAQKESLCFVCRETVSSNSHDEFSHSSHTVLIDHYWKLVVFLCVDKFDPLCFGVFFNTKKQVSGPSQRLLTNIPPINNQLKTYNL